MRKIMIGLFALLSFQFANATPTFAPYVEAKTELQEPVKQETKELSVSELIALYSAKYQVSSSEMWRVIRCEDKSLNPKKQSDHIYYFSDPKRNIVQGTRERSFGLVQIHLPDHPDISYEQATDPEFAIKFLAKNLAKGNGPMWSCY